MEPRMRKQQLFRRISQLAEKNPKDLHAEVCKDLNLTLRNGRRLIAQWERHTGSKAPAKRKEYDTDTSTMMGWQNL